MSGRQSSVITHSSVNISHITLWAHQYLRHMTKLSDGVHIRKLILGRHMTEQIMWALPNNLLLKIVT